MAELILEAKDAQGNPLTREELGTVEERLKNTLGEEGFAELSEEVDKLMEELHNGMIVTNEDVLKPVLLNQRNINDGTLYERGYAYCAPPYYYLYRGPTLCVEFQQKLPGIYLAPDDHYIWIPVTEGNEDKEWLIEEKFATTDQRKIIEVLLKQEDVSLNIPESGKVFQPDECDEDDILKRAIKRVLKAKDIDIDKYKAYFADKNALFNFKQVVKNPKARLSMLLFERGCNALNLKYTITIEELDPNRPRGGPLRNPITVCSEDTYTV